MLRRTYFSIYKYYALRKYCSKTKTVLPPIGFIGCGSMGSVLIKNLLERGCTVLCFDKRPKKLETVGAIGAKMMKSPAEVAKSAHMIFTLLPDYKSIVDLMESEDGLIGAMKKGTLLIDMSTIGPVNALRVEMALEGSGVHFLSAPVSGGARTDVKDSVIFLVGGHEQHLAKAKPFFHQMAAKEKERVIFHIGNGIGDGQSARMCNILLEGCCMVGTSEIMNLGIKLGLNPNILYTALNRSSAQCWICEEYNPVPNVVKHSPASTNYEGGETIYVLLKSLAVAQDTATKIFSPIPVSSLACQIFTLALARGLAMKDFSAVYKILQQTVVKAV